MEHEPISNDPDTNKLLSIVTWNLRRFFGYDTHDSQALVRSFYATYSSTWDDDFYHHEGPFRSAAFIHYMTTTGGMREGFMAWLDSQGFSQVPPESSEHFRQNYVIRRRPETKCLSLKRNCLFLPCYVTKPKKALRA
jgi:hypothetical protein